MGIALALVTLGCGSPSRPAFRAPFAMGTVHAAALPEAERVARTADALAACLTDGAPQRARADLEVWVVDGPLAGATGNRGVDGESFVTSGRIRVRGDHAVGPAAILGHELAHVFFQQELGRLPWAVGEGACDTRAVDCLGDEAAPLVARRLLAALQVGGREIRVRVVAPGLEVFELRLGGGAPASFAEAVGAGEQGVARGAGFLVAGALVQRLGWSGLLAWCRDVARDEARVGERRITVAECLEATGDDLEALAAPHVSAAVLDAIVDDLAPGVALLLERTSARWGPDWPRDFLARDPSLEIEGLPGRVRVADHRRLLTRLGR